MSNLVRLIQSPHNEEQLGLHRAGFRHYGNTLYSGALYVTLPPPNPFFSRTGGEMAVSKPVRLF